MKQLVDKKSKGPNESQREKLRTFLWGEVRNQKNEIIVGRIETCNGYQLTYLAAIDIATYLIENEAKSGAFTPSKLISNQIVFDIPTTSEIIYS